MPECRMKCGEEEMGAGDIWNPPPVKTGKLTGEAAGGARWQLTGFLARRLGGGIGGIGIRKKGNHGMLPPLFAHAGGRLLLPLTTDVGRGAGIGKLTVLRVPFQGTVIRAVIPGAALRLPRAIYDSPLGTLEGRGHPQG